MTLLNWVFHINILSENGKKNSQFFKNVVKKFITIGL